MILHPAVIANMVASLVISATVVYAAACGVQILRKWNLRSGEERQLRLERRTYLISTILAFVFTLELISLFLYVFTANALCPLFVGAMCAAGTLNVNAYGYPTLLFKIVNVLLAGTWLILNAADNRAYDYPLIKKKYALLALIAPLCISEAVLQGAFFLNLRADAITSCCGRLFSGEQGGGLGSALAMLPSGPMLWIFVLSMGWTLLVGFLFWRRGRGGYLYALSTLALFGFSLVSIVSFISPYLYEMPTHHCPFCLIMKEYGYVGYPVYLALFTAAVTGIGVGALLPFRTIPSLREVVPTMTRRLVVISLTAFAFFTSVALFKIATSNLIM